MRSQNSKTSDSYRLVLNLTDKMYIQRGNKRIELSDFSTYYTWDNMKKSSGNNELETSETKRDEEFELPDGSYTVYETILIRSSSSMKHLVINHQSKYMSIKFKIELHSRLKLSIFSNF